MSDLSFFVICIIVYLLTTGFISFISYQPDLDPAEDEWQKTGWPGSLEPPQNIKLSKLEKIIMILFWPLVIPGAIYAEILLPPGLALYYKYKSKQTTDPHLKARYELQSLLASNPSNRNLMIPTEPEVWIQDRAQKFINGT